MNINTNALHSALYQTIKNMIGVISAILISNLLGLNFPLSAGIIAVLSMLDSRKETALVGIRRIIIGLISLVVASMLFKFAGYNLWALSAFIVLVSFFAYITSSAFSIASSLVLTGHLYQIGQLNAGVFLNEVYILLIGVATGFLLTLHMPDEEKYLKNGIKYIETQYKNHLIIMAHNLKNHFILEHNVHSLAEIEKSIKRYREAAGRYRNNSLFKKQFDYDKYFAMRLEQVYRLIHMKEKLEILFIAHHEADKLSEFTQIISSRFSAQSPVDDLLKLTKEYYAYFKKRPLPKTREEFECRATLFQYLVEMEEFLLIKARYLETLD